MIKSRKKNSVDIEIPTVSFEDNILYLKDFPKIKLTRQASGIIYNKLNKIIPKQKPFGIQVDLTNVTPKDIHALALLDSISIVCSRNKVRVCLSGINEELSKMLDKLDFHESCEGIPEEIKILEADPIFETLGNATYELYNDAKKILGFIGELTSAISCSIRHPRKVLWKETFYYMDKTGADAVPIIFLMCFLMGAILAFQGVVQMGRFGLSVYVANLVGLSIVKELGALMVAIICIGRAGSAFAAEIGTMKVSEEIDAMETMGLKISRFLVIPKVIALVCVMPLLTIIGDVAGILGGMLVAVLKGGISTNEFYQRTIQAVTTSDLLEGIMKSLIFATLIAMIGCLRGFEAENDAKGVGRATTSSVVSGIFLIVVADAIITALIN